MTMSLRKAAASLLFVVLTLGGVEPPVCAVYEHDQEYQTSLPYAQRSESAISARCLASKSARMVPPASNSPNPLSRAACAPACLRGKPAASLQSLHTMLTL